MGSATAGTIDPSGAMGLGGAMDWAARASVSGYARLGQQPARRRREAGWRREREQVRCGCGRVAALEAALSRPAVRYASAAHPNATATAAAAKCYELWRRPRASSRATQRDRARSGRDRARSSPTRRRLRRRSCPGATADSPHCCSTPRAAPPSRPIDAHRCASTAPFPPRRPTSEVGPRSGAPFPPSQPREDSTGLPAIPPQRVGSAAAPLPHEPRCHRSRRHAREMPPPPSTPSST